MRHNTHAHLAGLIVAVGAAVVTGHGLIALALGCGVPAAIGWLYPVITNGLVLVGYAATTHLAGAARGFACSVVIVAAAVSGLAQGAYLAGGVPVPAAMGLRFVIGGWPAMAALIAAHLLYLIGTSRQAQRPEPPEMSRSEQPSAPPSKRFWGGRS